MLGLFPRSYLPLFFLLYLEKLGLVVLPCLVEGPLEVALTALQVALQKVIQREQHSVVQVLGLKRSRQMQLHLVWLTITKRIAFI